MNKKEWDNSEEKVCECCGYETECKEYQHCVPSKPIMLCEICSHTHISKSLEYPKQFSNDSIVILKSIAWIANHLSDKIKGVK